MGLEAKIARETEFWDRRQAGGPARDPAEYRVGPGDRTDHSVPWRTYLGFPAQVQCRMDAVAALAGKRVLDLGTGTGFVASLLAAQKAEVDAVDVSEASLAVARWRAEVSGVAGRIRFHAAPAERLPFPDGCFDAICGAFVLHHLDLGVAAPELRRVLRPGCRAAFIETIGNNRLLMTARAGLTGRMGIERASSADEAPLAEPATAVLLGAFGGAVRFSFPSTLVFRMLSYVPPLHTAPARAVLGLADAVLHRFPALHRFSYYGVVSLGE